MAFRFHRIIRLVSGGIAEKLCFRKHPACATALKVQAVQHESYNSTYVFWFTVEDLHSCPSTFGSTVSDASCALVSLQDLCTASPLSSTLKVGRAYC